MTWTFVLIGRGFRPKSSIMNRTSIVLLFLCLFLSSEVWAGRNRGYVPGELIIRYKRGDRDSHTIESMGNMSRRGRTVKRSWARLRMTHYKLEPNKSVEQAIQEISQDPNVEFVEPNYYLEKATDDVPAEILSKDQFSELANSFEQNNDQVDAQAMSYSQTGAPIYVPEAWAQMTNISYQPIVAIIDTGIDLNHSSLSDAIWVNPGEIPNNGIDDDGNGYVDDVNGWNFVNKNNNPQDCDGHGTHVAGIVRGTTQNILSSPMASAKIKLMPVKFLDCNGNGTTSDAVQAIYYAVNNGAKVLNNSWGGSSFSGSLLTAITYSYNQKVSFVAAAGNYSSNNDTSPTYPAAYTVPNIIAVAATTDLDTLASFSNYGANSVQIASPGVSVYSTWPGNGFATLSGTSMATPFVSGIVAIMSREKPTMNGYQLKQIALASVDLKANLNGYVKSSGRANALTSLISAKAATVDSYQPAYSDTISGTNRTLASDLVTNGGGCGLVSKIYGDYTDGNVTKFQGPQNLILNILMIMLMMAIPYVLAVTLKTQAQSRRRWDRFMLGSKIYVESDRGDFVAQAGTISIGGLELRTDRKLELEDKINMVVESPDGKEQIEVHGKIVWSNEKQSYGVCFIEAKEQSLVTINEWTKVLVKS